MITRQLRGRVLLSEDIFLLQLLITRYIYKTGLQVDVVSNGEQAVKAALAGDYAIVIMSMNMPVMDGFTAVSILRAKAYDRPIIAMTASAKQKDKEQCLALGCNDFIAKPVQQEHLYRVLARYAYASVNEQVLVSTLYETNPDMTGLVETFLAALPDYIAQCQTALAVKNWAALGNVLHTLKGMGGSYGYKIITEVAEQAEQNLKMADYVALKSLLEKLEHLNGHAQRAYQQQLGDQV